MNSGKTFCQTSIDALKKRRCCHKCCEYSRSQTPFGKIEKGSDTYYIAVSKIKGFNQLLNHVLMFTHASGNWMYV